MSGVNKENYQGVPGTRSLKNQTLTATKRSVLNNVTNTTASQDSSGVNANGSNSGYTNSFGKVLRQAKSKLQSARVAGSLIPQTKRERTLGSISSQDNKENIAPPCSMVASAPAVATKNLSSPSSVAATATTTTAIAAVTAVSTASVTRTVAPAVPKRHLRSIAEESHDEYQSILKDEVAEELVATIVSTELATAASNIAMTASAEGTVPATEHMDREFLGPRSEYSGVKLAHENESNSSVGGCKGLSGVSTKVSITAPPGGVATTAATAAAAVAAAATTATNGQLRPNVNPDSKKKRPISTIVEPEELKKFKVCEKGQEYEWEDLDAEDINDPFMVSEYVNDIFEYLHKLEIMTLPNRHDLFKHANIQQNRDILVNWMVKIHNKFGLLPETLYLALNIMDRFLGKELVQLEKLQLVGTACLFIASKYEEVYSPSVKHFAYETDGACDEDEIKEGEKFILKTLKFNLNYPNPMNFLRRISKADDYDIQSRTLAKYLLEISVVDFKFIGILPSLCAAASMFLSRKMLGKGKWDGNLIHYSGGYSPTELSSVCNMLMDYLVQPVVHDELFKKYASRRFMKASVISRQWAKKVMTRSYDIMTLHETSE
ncbi:cyclin family protein Ecym_4429 [Eremothecium cymbalariae DBVPG|uniref:Uncharacterized protein n=1 Tax=Eremothecium cymbalariae (strain CBS 270.75 / DBVPG 7215 / KCTC 17166 / NRRL Y-17582) TaxID=931890 RepID=G8JTX3_ERECY|nr:hypothetical protein Ecym_4429 [Eremothecium cymbalariae DBVPG\